MNLKKTKTPRACLSLAIAAALFAPGIAIARDLGGGAAHTVRPGDTAESWTVTDGGRLTLASGAASLDINALASSIVVEDGASVYADGLAFVVGNGSTASLTNANITSVTQRALVVANNGSTAARTTVDVLGGHIAGGAYGASISSGGTLTLRGAFVEGTGVAGAGPGGTDVPGVGAVLFHGVIAIKEGSTVQGQTNGLRIQKDERTDPPGSSIGRTVTVDASKIEGLSGSGIIIDNLRNQPTEDAAVLIANGSQVIGGNGVAIDIATTNGAYIVADRSAITGDLRVASGAAALFRLQNGATMSGAMNGAIQATVADNAVWTVTSDSEVSSLGISAGAVRFAPQTPGTVHSNLTVHGDLAGGGGELSFNTDLNEGGALSHQATDRLLVEGNVTTTSPIQIVVRPTGAGALTDANQNGAIEAGEGISLVQVGGTSRADAFTLRGGYVAAGPWQYTLHAFGPGAVDQAQNALAAGPLNWDYRLGSLYVCQTDCDPVDPTKPVDPGNPGNPGNPGDPGNPGNPGNPGDPENPVDPAVPPANGRPAVVPQLPSYLSAPAALLTYGDMMSDGLHQRLGDMRTGSSQNPIGGDVFARYLGGQMRYSSNLSFQKYGYNFDQQVNALQVGGSLIALDGDNGTWRAGWAADHGTTRVTPKAADGNSSAKYNANGISAWMTWQQGNGLWVDGLVGSTRYQGDVATDLRGGDVGRVHANGWTMSVEVGKPFALGNAWTIEPRFQLKHHSLTFRDFTDGDGLDVRLGTARQTSMTAGTRIMRSANPVFMPYANLDLTHTSGGDPTAVVSNADWGVSERFGTGRVGDSYRVAAGAVSQLGEHVQLYGEGTYQHFVGSYGMQGWAGNVGIRVTF